MSGCEAGGGRRAGRQRLLGGGVAASIDAPPRGGGSSNQLAVAMSSDSIVSVVEVRDTAAAGGRAEGDFDPSPLFFDWCVVFLLGGARLGVLMATVVRNQREGGLEGGRGGGGGRDVLSLASDSFGRRKCPRVGEVGGGSSRGRSARVMACGGQGAVVVGLPVFCSCRVPPRDV